MVLTKAEKFQFKQFEIVQNDSAMKVNSDGVLLGAWTEFGDAQHILDIGTGTGLIALMAAQKSQASKIVGVEIDEGSYDLAFNNFKNSTWSDKLTAVKDTIQNYGKDCTLKFDHIVSNPPFFSGGTLSDNQPKNVFRHTIKLSHGDLLLAIRRLLHPQGRVSMILPVIEGLRFLELIQRYRFHIRRKTILRPRKNLPAERILFEFGMNPIDLCDSSHITMYKGDKSEYDPSYKEITKAFYLNA